MTFLIKIVLSFLLFAVLTESTNCQTQYVKPGLYSAKHSAQVVFDYIILYPDNSFKRNSTVLTNHNSIVETNYKGIIVQKDNKLYLKCDSISGRETRSHLEKDDNKIDKSQIRMRTNGGVLISVVNNEYSRSIDKLFFFEVHSVGPQQEPLLYFNGKCYVTFEDVDNIQFPKTRHNERVYSLCTLIKF